MHTDSSRRGGRRKESAFADAGKAPPGPAVLNRFVRRIDEMINASGKTQRQIALELGYDRPNMVTMFKQGTKKIRRRSQPSG